MKYIRTKDGRIEAVDEQDHGRIADLYPFIEKEADTIEELCDEFVKVVEEENATTRLIKGYLKEVEEIREMKPNKITMFGAIWTDKGLKYVAKMNEKGEWELL